jgi:adenylate kinase
MKNDRLQWLQGPPTKCSSTPECSSSSAGCESPWRLVLLGAPGVGKGTQAEYLTDRLGACHLSTGDVFRAASKRLDCDQSPAMKTALDFMRHGELVPDSTVWDMVRERCHCLLHCGGFILDGFPRTIVQAQSLQELLETEGLSLTAVVDYELPTPEIVQRLGGRRTCEGCKAVFHVTERPSKGKSICDRCGGRLYQREDDQPASIKVRLDAYELSTKPLIEFYKGLGLLVPVSAKGTPEGIALRTVERLNALNRMANAASRRIS